MVHSGHSTFEITGTIVYGIVACGFCEHFRHSFKEDILKHRSKYDSINHGSKQFKDEKVKMIISGSDGSTFSTT